MIDGVKCTCVGTNAAKWLDCDLLNFGLLVSDSTGEILSNRKQAEKNGLQFSIVRQSNGNNLCCFIGSLHRFKNGGGFNNDNFTFTQIQSTLHTLEKDYHVNILGAQIQTLEVGVNIPLKYSPNIIIKNAICHKGNIFDTLKANRRHKVGKVVEYTDYSVKLYDKGLQAKNGENILRVEVKIHRPRMLEPYKIKTLTDLTNKQKVFGLLALLWENIEAIIFYDFSYKCEGLSEAKAAKWQRYSNPYYWQQLKRRQREKARNQYLILLKKYNCIDWRSFVQIEATKTWFDLAGLQAEKGRLFPYLFEKMKAQKRGTFSELDYMLEKVALRASEKRPLKSEKNTENQTKEIVQVEKTKIKCFCVSCGRDITHQKKGSRFCSFLYFDKQAKKCRNKESNRRLALKRKIQRAKDNQKLLKVIYVENGQEYAKTLEASIITVARNWLDKVVSMEVVKPQKKLKKTK